MKTDVFKSRRGAVETLPLLLVAFFTIGTLFFVNEIQNRSQDLRSRAQVYPTRYSCEQNGQCIESTTGFFTDFATCDANCDPPPASPSPTPITTPDCQNTYAGKCVALTQSCSPSTNYGQVNCLSTQKCVPEAASCTGGGGGTPIVTPTPVPIQQIQLANKFTCTTSGCVSSPDGFFETEAACRTECLAPTALPTNDTSIATMCENQGFILCSKNSQTCKNNQEVKQFSLFTHACCVTGCESAPEKVALTKCNYAGQSCNKKSYNRCYITEGKSEEIVIEGIQYCTSTTCDYSQLVSIEDEPFVCSGGILCTGCTPNMTLKPPSKPLFVCSDDGYYQIPYNEFGEVDRFNMMFCASGCSNGSCVGKSMDCTSATAGSVSRDGFFRCEYAKDSNTWKWKCIPGKKRPALTSEINELYELNSGLICDEDGFLYPDNSEDEGLQTIVCRGNTAYTPREKSEVFDSSLELVKVCSSNQICIPSKYKNNGVALTIRGGCFDKNFFYKRASHAFGCQLRTPLDLSEPFLCDLDLLDPALPYCEVGQTFQIGAYNFPCVTSGTGGNIVVNKKITTPTLTEKEYEMLKGSGCPLYLSTVFNGSVAKDNGTFLSCRLYCAYEGDEDVGVVRHDLCGPAAVNASTFLTCSQDKSQVIEVDPKLANFPGDGKPVAYCGWDNGQALCKDGHCMQKQADACSDIGKIKPDREKTNAYLICNSDLVWEPLLQSKPIAWEDCPSSFQEEFLKTISHIGGAIFPPEGIVLRCFGDSFANDEEIFNTAGLVTAAAEVPIIIGCGDPNNKYRSNWCTEVLAHELAHSHQVFTSGSFENPEYSRVVGCEQNSDGSYTFSRPLVSDYAHTNCDEAYAEAVAIYVADGCRMKNAKYDNDEFVYRDQYDFVKDAVFHGKEFCEEETN